MSNHLSRRYFVGAVAFGGVAAALSACATPAASPTAAPKPAATTAPAKPTAGAATKPAASPAAKAATQAPASKQPTLKVKHGFIRGIFDGAYVLAARKAGVYERAGIDMVWVGEGYGFDVPTTLGYLAARTRRVRLGLLVTGAHHQPHHLAMARGEFAHRH